MVFGAIILAVGVIAILVQTGVVAGSIWDYTWPIILVIIGLSFIIGRFRRSRHWMWWGGPPWWGDRDKDKDRKE
jgi:hypothetical protein